MNPNETRKHRPRVVFVDHIARLSGGEIALLRLLPTLAEFVEATVVLGEHGPLGAVLEQAGIHVEVLPVPEATRDLRKGDITPSRFPLSQVLSFARAVLSMRRFLCDTNVDIVHTNSLKAAVYAGIAGRAARVPVVWHIRDHIERDYLPVSAVRVVRMLAKVVPSAVVANSRLTAAALSGSARPKTTVVYDCVESPAYLGSRHEVYTVGLVGRIAPWKGQHLFLEAFAKAFCGGDERAKVIGSPLFGEERYFEYLRQLARQLGIAGQVDFTGFKHDVWAELATLDVLVHCSITPEPFGQVVLEGMAAGLAVVAANEGGPAEIITDGADGILFPPRDPDALARALVKMRDEPRRRLELGRAAIQTSEAFSPAKAAQQLLAVYEQVVLAKSKSRMRRRGL